jgi:hypothetical protein
MPLSEFELKMVKIIPCFRAAGDQTSSFAGFTIGIAMAMQHPEWAQAMYKGIKESEAAPDPDEMVEIILNACPFD